MLEIIFSFAFLSQVIRITIPYALAAQSGVISERAGVIHLGLEGFMLMSALSGAYFGVQTQNWVMVIVGAMLGGLVVALVYGVCVIRFSANQIIASVAINLMAMGLTRTLLKAWCGSSSNSPPVPGVGGDLWSNPMVWISVFAIVAVAILFARSRFGLILSAVGEKPSAPASVGIFPDRIKWQAILAASLLSSLAGAWLVLSNRSFVADMTGGRGYIALAAVIMGKWQPLGSAAACLLFGLAEAIQYGLQISGSGLPRELTQIIPYVFAIIVLSGVVGRSRAPAALGHPSTD